MFDTFQYKFVSYFYKIVVFFLPVLWSLTPVDRFNVTGGMLHDFWCYNA